MRKRERVARAAIQWFILAMLLLFLALPVAAEEQTAELGRPLYDVDWNDLSSALRNGGKAAECEPGDRCYGRWYLEFDIPRNATITGFDIEFDVWCDCSSSDVRVELRDEEEKMGIYSLSPLTSRQKRYSERLTGKKLHDLTAASLNSGDWSIKFDTGTVAGGPLYLDYITATVEYELQGTMEIALDHSLSLAAGEQPPMIGTLSLAAEYCVGEEIGISAALLDSAGVPIENATVSTTLYAVALEGDEEERTPIGEWVPAVEASGSTYVAVLSTADLIEGIYDVCVRDGSDSDTWARIRVTACAEETSSGPATSSDGLLAGEVTAVDGGVILISLGSADGVQVGDRFDVFRVLVLASGQTMEERRATIAVTEIISADRSACSVVELLYPIEAQDVIRGDS